MHDNDTDTTVTHNDLHRSQSEINSKSIKPFMSYLNSDKRYLADMNPAWWPMTDQWWHFQISH